MKFVSFNRKKNKNKNIINFENQDSWLKVFSKSRDHSTNKMAIAVVS